MSAEPSLPGLGESPASWSVRRAEQLLSSLSGVLSARIVAGRGGEIEEIHVLVTSEVQPKQAVRNVESALMAQLGMKVDHRKISVAQTAEVRPLEVLEKEAVAEAANRRKLVYADLVIESPRPRRVRVRVVDAFDRKVVLAAVHGVGNRSAQLLVGACEVRESPELAAVLAVLDATNRWYLVQR